ncbi:single-stranded DNA-binding protein [Propionimicrobium sp. PCR01-08-3]|uniref:single-stranded DNA-binding protein n=1 Tax=Propionimicrobium sp. PCR01-08-3 TaxID=3052086 RepID=UPI00255CB3D4|nr:single-stranded DNA-binding protein [Propionimicrobium sp. PCR01-08-3]WIY83457.1 single-stranded DNA-binding protein [Propionimicrobium sp. PCR01-08-3]
MDVSITITGNLGTEVDYKATENFSRASFRMACTPRLRRGDTWIDGYTTWMNVECTNRLADNVRDSLSKGDPVIVFGKLRTRVWESEGARHEKLVVEASAIGHDLGRGTSAFTRVAFARQPDDAAQAGDQNADGDDRIADHEREPVAVPA